MKKGQQLGRSRVRTWEKEFEKKCRKHFCQLIIVDSDSVEMITKKRIFLLLLFRSRFFVKSYVIKLAEKMGDEN